MNVIKKYNVIVAVFLMILISPFMTFSQDDFPLNDRYPFVLYEKNSFSFPGDKKQFEDLFAKFDTLIFFGTNKLTVLQIGASHTQADIFTGQLRMRLQTMYPGLSAGRGYVFPYNLTKTNSPYSYIAKHTGNWTVCRNVENKDCEIGLTGIVATTFDEGASISIILRDNLDLDYSFDYVKILHSTDAESFQVVIFPDSLVLDQYINSALGYSEFWLRKPVKEITFKVEKSELEQNHFNLYGIFLENLSPGIVFHPVGINGASTTSYTKTALFEKQLIAINPDWIIIALGTNDGYTSHFDSVYFKNNFKHLIQKIKNAKPDVAITIIVPNDDYYRRKYPNPNTEIQARVIIELAKEEGCAVWNMYEIMGGYNSSNLWFQNGLMAYDLIHFTNAGYKHLADLFFTAFIDAYSEFMNQ